jgi:cellulose synthase/poly-beta-1,6-N-acetylglucosamine synthase-like glycosyltransferase
VKVSVVIPTVGRPSLNRLLSRLSGFDLDVLVVDDRRAPASPLPVPAGVRVVPGPARGPAAARNAGWRAARHDWIAFLDDDVLPDPDWTARLVEDLDVPAHVGGVQGVLRVPLPAGRAPTDWERVTAGLTSGAWITADMAYRRAALTRAGGFDERLPRAFREDAEVAFRVRRAGWSLRRGRRTTVHPVRPESPWVSVRTQRGNADDALLRHLSGRTGCAIVRVPRRRRQPASRIRWASSASSRKARGKRSSKPPARVSAARR